MTTWMPQSRRHRRRQGLADEFPRRGRRRGAGFRLCAVGAGLFVLGLGLGVASGSYLDKPRPAAMRIAVEDVASGGMSPAADPATADSGVARAGSVAAASQVVADTPQPPIAAAWSEPSDIPEQAPEGRLAAAADMHVAPAWRRHAVAVQGLRSDVPKVAIVIDDLGLNRRSAREVIGLPPPLTLAFMTYAPAVESLTEQARAAGHELMVHVPMQPANPEIDPGPRVLRGDLSATELLSRLRWGLSRFHGYVGINNHMGSAFTSEPEAMRVVLRELASRGLLFLDSLTAAESVAQRIAGDLRVPHAGRDIFLDNDRDPAAIRRQLARVEAIARRTGRAIAIGHPHAETIAVLREWIADVRTAGIKLVPVSALVHTGRHGRDVAKAER